MSDWRSLYPFESHFYSVPDGSGLPLRNLKLHFLDEGPTEAPVLLFVHGNPTWSFYWRNLVLGLRAKYRCIVVDNMGCGLSDKGAALNDYPFTLGRRAQDLSDLIKYLDLKQITFVLHDWGGVIGMGAAVKTPDRVKQFVCMNTSVFGRSRSRCPFPIALARRPFLGKLMIQGLHAFCLAASRWTTEKPLAPEVKAGLIAPYNNWANRRAVYQFVQDIPFNEKDRSWAALKEVETGLDLFKDYPFLFPWGLKDWCFGEDYLRIFEQKFPNHKTIEFPNVGHYITEEIPDELVSALDTFMQTEK